MYATGSQENVGELQTHCYIGHWFRLWWQGSGGGQFWHNWSEFVASLMALFRCGSRWDWAAVPVTLYALSGKMLSDLFSFPSGS